MLTNSKRIELIRRLEVLTHEMQEITQVLNANPCPTTDEDIERGVQSLLQKRNRLHLTSLERQMANGIPSTVFATYYPSNEPHQRLKAYSQETTDELLMVFQRLIDIGEYTVEEGDEDAKAFCLQLRLPNPDQTQYEFIVTEEEPNRPLIQLGPKRQIRQKVADEALESILKSSDVDRATLERAVVERQKTIDDDSVLWFHVVPKELPEKTVS